jgi:hypothetical protein
VLEILNNGYIKRKLSDVMTIIEKFLVENLSNCGKFIYLISVEVFSLTIGKKNQFFAEIIVKFFDLYKNISKSRISQIIDPERKKNFKFFFQNFKAFTNIPLKEFRETIFEKKGFYLDFKGNFSIY